MAHKVNKALIVAGMAALTATSALNVALAGGFDRGGVNIDQLFDKQRFSFKTETRHVMPQRKLKNVRRGENAAANAQIDGLDGVQDGRLNQAAAVTRLGGGAVGAARLNGAINAINTALPVDTDNEIKVDADFTTYSVGIKMGLATDFNCLLTYTEPFGADANYGENNAYSASATKFSISTRDYGATCGYSFDLGETSLGASSLRLIAGGSYQQLEGFQARQRFLDFANAGAIVIPGTGVTNSAGIGTFTASGDSLGYRLGVAYEIPDIALRAMVLYHSKYDYDLDGVQDNTGFGALIPVSRIVPITASTEIPQAVEIRLQSGINEKTLGFLNMKWQQWSNLGIIPIHGGISPIDGRPTALSFDPEYQDGYTISGGIGRQLTEQLSGLVGLGWDRGTSTTTGSQTDTYTLSAGLSYRPTENLELNFGGLVGVLTDGDSEISPFGDAANNVTYDFDDDAIYALSASVKLSF